MKNPLKSYINKRKKIKEYRKLVNAAFYTATSESPNLDFSFASGVSLNEALISDLKILRNRIRYELRQNSPAKGILRSYANACIGRGPTLSIDTDNKQWGEDAEWYFSLWAEKCGYTRGESLGEILHLGVRQFFIAGEYFRTNLTDRSSDSDIKLRVALIRPDRVESPMTLSDKIINGVEFGPDNKPKFYYLIDDQTENKIPSDKIAHIFYPEDVEQVRGEPWLAAGLPDLHMKRRYDTARVAAAVVAAKFALFLINKDPNIEIDPDEILPDAVIELNDGAATVLPPHYEVQSFSGAQPTAGATDFRREMIANAGAGAGIPTNIANMDSGNSNFASARFDAVGFDLEVEFVRHLIENRDLTPLFETFLKEAQAVRLLGEAPDYRCVWRWAVTCRHTDPLKAAKGDSERVEKGLASKSAIWAEHGLDKEKARADLLDDVEWHKQHGLKHPLVSDFTTEENVIEDLEDSEEEE